VLSSHATQYHTLLCEKLVFKTEPKTWHYTALAFCITIHLLVILHIFLPKTATISSSTPSKRVRNSSSSQEEEDQGHLESWFTGDAEQMQTYIHSYNQKSLTAPKFVTSRWLKEQQLNEIIGILNHQKM